MKAACGGGSWLQHHEFTREICILSRDSRNASMRRIDCCLSLGSPLLSSCRLAKTESALNKVHFVAVRHPQERCIRHEHKGRHQELGRLGTGTAGQNASSVPIDMLEDCTSIAPRMAAQSVPAFEGTALSSILTGTNRPWNMVLGTCANQIRMDSWQRIGGESTECHIQKLN